MKKKKILIIGDGGWGTALAIIQAAKGHAVTLFSLFPEYARYLKETRKNTKFLPSALIPKEVRITARPKEAVRGIDFAIVAVPTLHLRKWLGKFKRALKKDIPIVSGCKGIEKTRLKRASEIIREELGSRNILVLSGPSHAEEVAMRKPTTVVIAGEAELAKKLQRILSTNRFRIYVDDDIVGVEIGGALKQIIGIACGICDGLGFGDNTKAALMTRGVVEIARLGTALGADGATFWGLSGIGDIITTAVSPFGRNRAVGEAIGRGKKLKEIVRQMHMVVAEGVETTRSARRLAKRKGIEMPITEEVYQVLYKNKSPHEAVSSLMRRAPRKEKEK